MIGDLGAPLAEWIDDVSEGWLTQRAALLLLLYR